MLWSSRRRSVNAETVAVYDIVYGMYKIYVYLLGFISSQCSLGALVDGRTVVVIIIVGENVHTANARRRTDTYILCVIHRNTIL